jgi:hypothetical protein
LVLVFSSMERELNVMMPDIADFGLRLTGAGNDGSISFTIKHILCNRDLGVELLSPCHKEKHESEGPCELEASIWGNSHLRHFRGPTCRAREETFDVRTPVPFC